MIGCAVVFYGLIAMIRVCGFVAALGTGQLVRRRR